MKVFALTVIGYFLALLLYRLIVQHFKKYNKENIGLCGIMIMMLISSRNLLQLNMFILMPLIIICLVFMVMNSMVLSNYDKKTL